jgi:hypothetical protein
MQIQLKQLELELAVRAYLVSMGVVCNNDAAIKFSPTRGSDGIVTEIEIGTLANALAEKPIDGAIALQVEAPVALLAKKKEEVSISELIAETVDKQEPEKPVTEKATKAAAEGRLFGT